MDSNPRFRSFDHPLARRSRTAPVIERAPLPMVEVEGAEHHVCFVNDAFCSLLQQDRDELIGRRFSEIVFNGENCVPLLDRVYKTGEFETHAEPDGSKLDPVYWLFAMWPTLDVNEQPIRVVIQLTRSARLPQDAVEMNQTLLIAGLRQHELREAAEQANARLLVEIAGRKEVESALRSAKAQLRAEADELENLVVERTTQLRNSISELEAFSYSLAHDLRAPVRAIQGFTQLALELPNDQVGPDANEMLNHVVKSATRMDSLIQDVLSLTGVILKPIKLSSIDVEALIRTLILERPEFSPAHATIKIQSPLLCMFGHEASLSQCISNLLSNAVKFVEPGARPDITIWTEEKHSSVAVASPEQLASPRESSVRLYIEDQGIGIAEEHHERIFQIFQTAP